MKVIHSLAITLLSIFSIFASATIRPIRFNMVANANQMSIAISEFQSDLDLTEGGNHGQVAFFFPGHFPTSSPTYSRLDCTTAISTDDLSKPSVIKRSTVSRLDDPSGYTRVNHDFDFNDGEVLGRFSTICSFIAPETARGRGVALHSSVAVGNRTSMMSDNNTVIRPFKSVIEGFAAYVSPTFSIDRPTAFRIVGIDKSSTPDNQFIIRNPNYYESSTGAILIFSTNSPTASCDVYWDNVLYENSAEATIVENGGGVHFNLGSPLNSANELILYCYELRGVAFTPGLHDNAKFFPSMLDFTYAKSNKAYTVAITPSRPDSTTFESGFTPNTLFPHFTPYSVLQ